MSKRGNERTQRGQGECRENKGKVVGETEEDLKSKKKYNGESERVMDSVEDYEVRRRKGGRETRDRKKEEVVMKGGRKKR